MSIRRSLGACVAPLLAAAALFAVVLAGQLGRATDPPPAQEDIVIADEELRLLPGESRSWTVEVPEWTPGMAPGVRFEARAFGPAMSFNRAYALEIRVNGSRVSSWQNRKWLRLRNRPIVKQTQRYGSLYAEQFLGWLVLAAPDFDSDPNAFTSPENLGPEAFRYVIDLDGLLEAGPNTISFRHVRSSINLDTMYIRGVRMVSVPAYVPPPGPAGRVRPSLSLRPDGTVVGVAGFPDACSPARCGDGVRQTGEECDDGNTAAGDGCASSCLLEQP